MVQTVNNPPAMRETWVRSLGGEDALEKMATHSSFLAWRIPWPDESGRLKSIRLQRVHWVAELDMTEVTEHATMYLSLAFPFYYLSVPGGNVEVLAHGRLFRKVSD